MKKIKQRKGTWRGSWGTHFKQGSPEKVRGTASAQKPMGSKGVRPTVRQQTCDAYLVIFL